MSPAGADAVPVTVVVPALNAEATLLRQLRALDRQRCVGRFIVIVVDNASTDDTSAIADDFAAIHFDRCTVTETRRGINAARNAGIAAAADGIVVLCDADDEVDDGWLAAMCVAIRPGTWVAGALDYARLNDDRTRRLWDAARRSTNPLSSFAGQDARPCGPIVDNTYGCNCGFYRSMWEELGGFDARLSGPTDEFEFFARARAAGYSPTIVPDAVIGYRLRPSINGMLRQRHLQGRNQVRAQRLSEVVEERHHLGGVTTQLLRTIAAGPMDVVRRRSPYVWLAALARHSGRFRELCRRNG